MIYSCLPFLYYIVDKSEIIRNGRNKIIIPFVAASLNFCLPRMFKVPGEFLVKQNKTHKKEHFMILRLFKNLL